MPDDNLDSIFSLAGKQKPKPKVASPSPVTPPLAPAAPRPKPAVARNPNFAADYQKLKETFAKVQEMRDDLERSIEKVYQLTGLTKDRVKAMLDNPANFQGRNVNAADLQLRRQVLKQEIERMAGAEVVRALEHKAKVKEMDRQKHKSLGARRNWLNMR